MQLLPLILALLLCATASKAQYSIAYPDGRLELEGRLRLGWHHRFLFEGDEDGNKNRFYVQQARLKFSGTLYDSRMAWETQFELRGYNGLEREEDHEDDYQGFEAKDLHLSWRPSNQVTLRLGQQKIPYGRKQMVPQHAHSMVKRADIVDGFLPGRDRGLMLRARTPGRDFLLFAGLFTGNGENLKYNDPAGRYLGSLRLEWQPLGEIGKSEGDYGRSPRPLLLAGVNVARSHDSVIRGSEEREYQRGIDGRKLLYGADLSLKWRGLFLLFEADRARMSPAAGVEYLAGGIVAQASYYMEPALLPGDTGIEFVIQYDEFNPSDQTDGPLKDTQRTVTTGINLLPDGHDLKVMLDYFHRLKIRDEDPNPWKENEVRLIVQLRIK